MMGRLRNLVCLAVIALLAVGYAASQWAYFAGQGSDYAHRVDSAPVAWLALFLLIALIALGQMPDREVS